MSPDDRAQLVSDITKALYCSIAPLTEEEQQWVRMAIKREAQSIALRQAIIEKSLTSLVWSVLVGLGFLVVDFFKNHGFK